MVCCGISARWALLSNNRILWNLHDLRAEVFLRRCHILPHRRATLYVTIREYFLRFYELAARFPIVVIARPKQWTFYLFTTLQSWWAWWGGTFSSSFVLRRNLLMQLVVVKLLLRFLQPFNLVIGSIFWSTVTRRFGEVMKLSSAHQHHTWS